MRNSRGVIQSIVTILLAAVTVAELFAPPVGAKASGRADAKGMVPGRATEAVKAPSALQQGSLARLPLYFIENRGQVDPRVAYYVQGRDTNIYFTRQGLTFSLASHAAEPRAEAARRWSLKLDFVGANPRAKLTARDRAGAVVSYFKGAPSDWKSGLATYATVAYENLWPGIDLIYAGSGDHLKYTFVVKPGADPRQIKFAYRGATGVKVNDGGQLEVTTPADGLRDDKPYSYQQVNGARVPVATAYALSAAQRAGLYEYGFRIGDYDRSRPLIIDPTVLIYAGYIGGTAPDLALGIAIDQSGNAYVTGMTASAEATFPVIAGPDATINSPAAFDAFIAKVKADGSGLEYAGYIGGDGNDYGTSIAVDAAGNAYVTGATASSQATFPRLVGPRLSYGGGAYTGDAFVAKVNPSGTALVYCGYVGGSSDDRGIGIAVDSSGSAYVTGETGSSGGSFPASVGPGLTFKGGLLDAFVAKVKADGSGLVYAGYIGGGNIDRGLGIAVDSGGNAYVTGTTDSTEATFPVAGGPDLTHNGGTDAFIAKVKADGTGLSYCGYVGGSGNDSGNGIAVDSGGGAYIAGSTTSGDSTFPVKVGPDLSYNGGTFIGDAFVAKLTADGKGLQYCGYIGGSDDDGASRIAIDSAGNAYVTGATLSTESTFPLVSGPGLTFGGGDMFGDAFVSKVNASGAALVYSGYIGGSGDDAGTGIAVDSHGDAYVAGGTASPQNSFPARVGPDLGYNGLQDGFVAKISDSLPPDILLVDPPTGPTAGGTQITITGINFAAGATVLVGGDAATNVAVVNANTITATTRPHNPGSVEVTVTSATGKSATIANAFTFSGPPPVVGPVITAVSRSGKNLVITGRSFDAGAVILLNGERQKTIHDDQNPTTMLTGKKLAKFASPGDKLKVRNSDGSESPEWTYAP